MVQTIALFIVSRCVVCYGQEKFHGAIISHAGTDDTRIFVEFEQLGAELHQLGGDIPMREQMPM